MSFHWITPHLALGGRILCSEAVLSAEHGIAAVVDLREEACDDPAALSVAGVDLLHLPTPDHHPPAPSDLDRGVAFVRERLSRGQRVLIHCEHGIGRSAVLLLCVLVDAGMTPLAALTLAKNGRERVSPSQMQYEGWAAWLRGRGLQPPDFDSFGRIAYRHLAHS